MITVSSAQAPESLTHRQDVHQWGPHINRAATTTSSSRTAQPHGRFVLPPGPLPLSYSSRRDANLGRAPRRGRGWRCTSRSRRVAAGQAARPAGGLEHGVHADSRGERREEQARELSEVELCRGRVGAANHEITNERTGGDGDGDGDEDGLGDSMGNALGIVQSRSTLALR